MMNHLPLIISLLLLTGCKSPAEAVSKVEYRIIEDHRQSLLDSAIDSEIEAMNISKDYSIISGESDIDYETMAEFVKRYNKHFSPEIARWYIEVGRLYGIKGDMAFCQAIIETGWFKFEGGTAVKASQHNYCGLGVNRRGARGENFETIRDGVTAHIQHLYAYVSEKSLPEGEHLLDPRFNMVKRGSAATWHDLNMRWAMNSSYADAILRVYNKLLDYAARNSRPDLFD